MAAKLISHAGGRYGCGERDKHCHHADVYPELAVVWLTEPGVARARLLLQWRQGLYPFTTLSESRLSHHTMWHSQNNVNTMLATVRPSIVLPGYLLLRHT